MHKQVGWVFTAVGGVCLGAAAVGFTQQQSGSALAPPPAHAPDDLSTAFRDVAQRVLPAVVSISTETRPQELARNNEERGGARPEERMLREFFGNDPRFEQFFSQPNMRRFTPRQAGSGSGFIVDGKGIILTNSHVVEGADRVVVTLQDGHEVEAESWNYDPRSDVAVIRIPTDEALPTVVLGDSEQMQVGDWVLALGNPFNVGTTVTAGIVSATGRGPGINEREQFIQTDAAINPGNSGGPLVNLHGEVIGINTAISSRSGGYDGVSFAIPSHSVRWVAEQLIEHGEVKRSYLGVRLQQLTDELRKAMNVPFGAGALVADVMPNGPAAESDLQAGDVVVKFGDEKIRNSESLVDVVERSAANKAYPVTVLRDGAEKTINITLKPMPGDYTPALQRVRARDQAVAKPRVDNEEVSKLGLQLAQMSEELAGRLGVKSDVQGLVVTRVDDNGPAAAAGLRVGDVIQRVGSQTVNSLDDFREVLKDASESQRLVVHVRRGDGSSFLVIQAP